MYQWRFCCFLPHGNLIMKNVFHFFCPLFSYFCNVICMCLKCPTKAPPEAMVLVQVSASMFQSASVGSHFTGNQIKLRCRAHTRSPQILEQSQQSSSSHLYPHIPCPGPRSEVRWSLGLLTGHGTTAPMMSSFFSTSDPIRPLFPEFMVNKPA